MERERVGREREDGERVWGERMRRERVGESKKVWEKRKGWVEIERGCGDKERMERKYDRVSRK